MVSLKYRLLYTIMMNRHLLQGRLKREAWDWDTSIPAFRALCEKTNGALAKLPEGGVEVTPVTLDGPPGNEKIYAEWLRPGGAVKDAAILYTIGGGYVSGSCNDHRAMVARVAAGSGVSILQFDHSLAPERPFPAALEDTMAAYRWLLAQGFDPQRVMIVGESAGGGLCLAALLALKDGVIGADGRFAPIPELASFESPSLVRGRTGEGRLPLPAAAIALSPWTDLGLTGDSHRTRAKVCMSPPGMAMVCSKYYACDYDPCLPWISPLYGDLRGLPPLLIVVGDYETLLDDSTRFAARAREAGVDATLIVGEKMIHCYPLLAPLFPEAVQGLEQVCDFIRKHI